jgi:hypothetical protein
MAYTTQQIKDLIIAEARRQGVDPALALAVAQTESAFEWWQIGDKGQAVGVFQLHPAAAQEVGISPQARYDVPTNIRGGIAYLKNRITREGEESRGISAYNQGIGMRGGQLSNPKYVALVRQYQRQHQQQPGLFSRVARAVTPARAEAAAVGRDLTQELFGATAPPPAPRDAQGAAPRVGRDLTQELFGATAPPASPPGSTGPAAAPGLPHAPDPTAPMPWGQIARSAVRTASRGVLGGLPELAIPAVERMTDPTQVPQTAAGVGEMIGQSAGSAVLPGPGTAIGGTVGAVTGLTAGTLATEGRWPTWKEIGREAVWSAVPEIAESTVRGIVRHIGRGTQGGRLIRLDEAARRARDLPGVFQAPPRQQVGQQFDAVRASGLQLDTGIMQQEIQGLRQGKYEDLLAEVRRIDRGHKTGRRYEQLVENLRNPGPGVRVAGWPVGDLQQLRSAVRARAEELTSHEARQLLEDFQGAVDDAIDAGIARGRVPTGMTVADLQEARRQWARVRAHEDLSTLVERTIDVTPDLTMSSFKLKQLANSLRRNEGPLAQRINRALDQTGTRGAFQRDIEEVSQLYQTVELPLADVFGIWRAPGFAVVRQMISGVLASPTGRQIFRDAIIEGRGRLSLNGFAAAVNAARRESGLVFPAIPGLEAERAGATAPTTPGPGG